MLRMGKKDEENQNPTGAPDTFGYATPRSYPSYQGAETYLRTSTETDSVPRAVTESEALAREIKDGSLSGFIGGGTVVTGEVTFKAMLRVDGQLSGRITSSTGTLVVGAGGQVDANIEVAVGTIHGTVNGDIVASERIELGRAAKVNGNITTSSLVIEQGAVFEGSCKMIQQKAALEKSKKRDSKEDFLDVTVGKPVEVDGSNKKPEIPGIAALGASQ